MGRAVWTLGGYDMSSVEPPKAVRLTADGITAGVAVMPSVGVSSAWRVALLVSLAIHGALLTWAVVHFSTALPGARGVQLEGIEIEIISAAALEWWCGRDSGHCGASRSRAF
jgi:hypothetical protein